MTFDEVTELSLWFIVLVGLLVPAWITFIPPGPVKHLSIWVRPAIAIVGTAAVFYGFYFFVVVPYGRHISAEDSGVIYEGIFLWHPNKSWVGISGVSLIYFGILVTTQFFRTKGDRKSTPKAQQGSDGKPDNVAS